MAAGGNSFREFLFNLPKFHNRIYLSYPDLVAPEFKISDYGDSIAVEYHSEREGLTHLMEGMLLGIIKMFNEQHALVNLEYTKSNSTFDHDLFLITWIKN